MTFGWQGFTLEHPEDWAPVTLSGGRPEGYARIASPHRISLQVRWKQSKESVDLGSILTAYLDRLARDAKSCKQAFRSHRDERNGMLFYQYASEGCGRGAILRSPTCGRVFFLESVSTKKDSTLPVFRTLIETFSCAGDAERWSILGLDILTPKGLEVSGKVLQTGRTQLTLGCKQALVEAQRWGFAEQLLAKHGLEAWSRSILNMKDAKSEVTDGRASFSQRGSFMKAPEYGIVSLQADRNQLIAIKVKTRHESWRPTWDWLV